MLSRWIDRVWRWARGGLTVEGLNALVQALGFGNPLGALAIWASAAGALAMGWLTAHYAWIEGVLTKWGTLGYVTVILLVALTLMVLFGLSGWAVQQWRGYRRGAFTPISLESEADSASDGNHRVVKIAVKDSQGLAILGLEEKVQPSRSDPPTVTLATYVNIQNTSTVTLPSCKCTISYKELSLKGTVTTMVIGPLPLAAGEAKSIPVGAISRHRSISILRGKLDGLIQYQVTVTLYGDTHPHSAKYKMYVENKRLVVHRL